MSNATPRLKTPAGDRVAVASRSPRPLRCDPAPHTPRTDEARSRGNLLGHVAACLIGSAAIVAMVLL